MNTFASPGRPFRPASLLALLLAVPSLPGAAPAGEPERLASMVVTGTRQLGRSVTDSLAPHRPRGQTGPAALAPRPLAAGLRRGSASPAADPHGG